MKRHFGRLKSSWAQVNGLKMHARVGADPLPPDAPTVILVHGMVVASRYLEPTAERLATFCRVYVPDLPGYGRSDSPRALLTVSELADALAAWMNAVGLTQAALMGNSFGCQIIAALAVRHPHLIERAVLQGPTVNPPQRTVARQIKVWLINGYREPGKMTGIMLRDYWAAGLRRALHTLFEALEDKIEEKLPLIRAPVLVVRGAEDVIVPQSWAERIVELLPDGRLVVIPGVMHTIVYFNPLELVRVVRPFVLDKRPAAA
jgi:2-hydroxy-6-oxonona-2,4-dienedioate hydrolase